MLNSFLTKASNIFSDAKFSQIDRAEKLIQAGYLPVYDTNNKSINWIYAVIGKESLFGNELTMSKVNKDTARAIYDLINVNVDL